MKNYFKTSPAFPAPAGINKDMLLHALSYLRSSLLLSSPELSDTKVLSLKHEPCEDRVWDGPASGGKGLQG